MIVTTEDGPLALVVDALGDVVAVDDDRFEPPPETLLQPRHLIKGAFKLDDALLLDLDLDETLHPSDLTGEPMDEPDTTTTAATEHGHEHLGDDHAHSDARTRPLAARPVDRRPQAGRARRRRAARDDCW